MRLENRLEDSELGSWMHLDFRPTAHRAAVESVWLFRGILNRPERYYPTGTLDILIQLDSSPSFHILGGHTVDIFPPASLTGMLTAPLILKSPMTTGLLGVQLHPTGAAALFDLSLDEVTGGAISLEDLLGDEARRLTERLLNARSDRERVRVLTRWVLARMAARPRGVPEIRYAISELERTRGIMPIGELVKRLAVSPKRLTRLFRQHVGVTPKTYAKIVRFRGVTDTLTTTDVPLNQAALAYGYYDPAHMNAEFREFAGISPRQFRAAQRFPGSLSITA